jgi:uncharacterized protein YfdQ (DUF2303 family)
VVSLQGLALHQDRTKAICSNTPRHPPAHSSIPFTMTEPTIRTEADAIHEQSLLGVAPVKLTPGHLYAVRTKDGFKTIDLNQPDVLKAAGWERLNPQSSYSFHTIESFTSYVSKVFDYDKDDEDAYRPRRNRALCIADEAARTIRLVFDAQPSEWGTVYADLKLIGSPEAKRWLEASGKYMAQQDFAEFCELNLETFSSPDAATILEIAQTFQAKSTVDFSSAVRLSNGAIKLKREEQINATAGERADISIPDLLTVAMPIFKFGKAYAVKARLRYRIVDAAVKLSVLMVDPEMAIEHAFKEAMDEVSNLLEMPVFYGKV